MEHPENDDQYKGLKVNKGIADVPTVNPYIKKRVQRKVYTPSEFVEGILKGISRYSVKQLPWWKAPSMSTNRWRRRLSRNVCLSPGNRFVSVLRVFPERERVPLSTLSVCT